MGQSMPLSLSVRHLLPTCTCNQKRNRFHFQFCKLNHYEYDYSILVYLYIICEVCFIFIHFVSLLHSRHPSSSHSQSHSLCHSYWMSESHSWWVAWVSNLQSLNSALCSMQSLSLTLSQRFEFDSTISITVSEWQCWVDFEFELWNEYDGLTSRSLTLRLELRSKVSYLANMSPTHSHTQPFRFMIQWLNELQNFQSSTYTVTHSWVLTPLRWEWEWEGYTQSWSHSIQPAFGVRTRN